MDWHNSQCALIKKKGAYKKEQRRRQLEHQLKIKSCLFKVIMRAKCVLIMLE